jgi:pyruvate kinase
MTTSTRVWRKQNLSWGVTPVLCGTYDTMEEMFLNSMREAKVNFELKSGDNVVLTGGVLNGTSGNTNLIKVETIE